MFVVVHFRRPPNLFLFGLRKLYIFGNISYLDARGVNLSSTPTTDWRVNGETLDVLSFRTRGIDKKTYDTPVT